ncbi:MAG TPA: helix-turn-helix transcriptional regulator [Propionibacteriaceae bacterium]|nr:helix-turn-helix transcriptional regulator [Propionibacteriaceae bacterium]
MSADPDPAGYDALLGGYIRTQRNLADLSLRQLAAMTNVSNAYLSQIERGLHQPSVKVLRSIADALNLSGEALLSRAGMATPEKEQAQDATATETAILADAKLTDEEKQILLSIYRQFCNKNQ